MTRPRAVPRTVPRIVASGVTSRMVRAPAMTRDSTSRPSWSVPNQCAPDGPALLASRFCASGLYGAKDRPKIAHTTQNKMMAAPIRKVGRLSSSRHRAGTTRWAGTATMPPAGPTGPSGPPGSIDAMPPASALTSVTARPYPQPRVERDQQQVSGQRGQHIDHSDGEHPRFQHREVLG